MKFFWAKAITLLHEGKGTRLNATDALAWEKKKCCAKSLDLLTEQTSSSVIQHFGLKGRQLNYGLCVAHFKFAKNENGHTYATS